MPRFCAANFPPPFSHFPGLPNIMNINEVQRSNGVTRRNFVVEWCGAIRYLTTARLPKGWLQTWDSDHQIWSRTIQLWSIHRISIYWTFLYCACFFLPQLGISLVYWLNYSRRTVYYSPGNAWLGYNPLFTAFWVGARAKHTCGLCVFQNSHLTQCAQRRRTHTSE